MPKFVDSSRVLLSTIVLLAGLLTGVDSFTVLSVTQIIFLCAGFVYVCGFIYQPGCKNSLWPLAWVILLGAVILLIWFSQNRIIAIYLIGCIYLCTYFISTYIAADDEGGKFQTPVIATAIIGGVMSVVLLASPLSVSRIIVSLANLPVPSKFELQSAPGARHNHYASIGFPSHSLEPIDVKLNANNVRADEPMPLLQLQARRESNFTIEQIRYNFLYTTLYQLKFDGLHQVSLSDQSDEVTLSKVNNGIVIEDITGKESAMLQLPALDEKNLRSGAVLKSSGLKLILWLVICFAFFLWAPHRVWNYP